MAEVNNLKSMCCNKLFWVNVREDSTVRIPAAYCEINGQLRRVSVLSEPTDDTACRRRQWSANHAGRRGVYNYIMTCSKANVRRWASGMNASDYCCRRSNSRRPSLIALIAMSTSAPSCVKTDFIIGSAASTLLVPRNCHASRVMSP